MGMVVDGIGITVSGRFPRIARLEAEYYEWVDDPYRFVEAVRKVAGSADLFTFVQRIPDNVPRYDFHLEYDEVAVLEIVSYEEWWKKQINDKTRNMIRRSQKAKVEVRLIPFDDDLIRGIKEIYDESPVRQGKPFRHYLKSIEALRNEHGSFLDRSQFIGAFLDGELIGFIKLVHDEGVSHLMQIISKIAHRDKAPTNALMAKAVELCAEKGVRHLHYSTWSRRGLGEFKKHNAFKAVEVPRYFIPLNLRGRLALNLKLHREIRELLPQRVVDAAVEVRNRWNAVRMESKRVSLLVGVAANLCGVDGYPIG
ncbi:hypothetical protein GMSM_23630 [Geomonas sp. Red276]